MDVGRVIIFIITQIALLQLYRFRRDYPLWFSIALDAIMLVLGLVLLLNLDQILNLGNEPGTYFKYNADWFKAGIALTIMGFVLTISDFLRIFKPRNKQ